MMNSHLDQAFLIDVSEEDDSLLPARDKAMRRNADDQQHSSSGHIGCTAEAADVIQKDDLLCQQAPNGIPEEPGKLALPVMTEEPVLVKKKKTGFNVRKSLAWNNAFFTEEGVLDSEELSLVNRTFQKPFGLPKPGTFKKPIQASKPVKPPMMPKINLNVHNTALTVESKENPIDSAVISPPSSTGSLTGSVSKSSEQHVNNIKGPNRIRHGVITPISLANVHMDTSKKEKALAEAHADSESKLFLRRSLDKKDQVSSLPGVNRYNGEDRLSLVGADSGVRAATASGSVTSKGATNLKQISKDSRLINQSINKEAMRQSSLMKLTGDSISSTVVPRVQPVPSSMKFISETASTKTQHTTKKSTSLESGTFAGRGKPSGLRMPSPKLGFFDTSRTASQVAVPCERTGHGGGITGLGRSSKDVEIGSSRYSTNQTQGLKHPAALAKPSHQLLEASKKQTLEVRSSSNIPSAPHVHGHSAGVAAMRVPPAHELPRSASYPSNTVRKIDTTEQVLQARKNGQNRSPWGKPVRSQLATSTLRNVLGQENLSPDCKDGKGMLQKYVVAQGLALGNPNVNTCDEAIQKCQENAQNVHAPLRKSVSQPMEEVVVSLNQSCADTERDRISQTREEWPQEKSGSVQNSPPNRASPKHSQWSPVRRTIQQLGPFDCTKLLNTGVL